MKREVSAQVQVTSDRLSIQMNQTQQQIPALVTEKLTQVRQELGTLQNTMQYVESKLATLVTAYEKTRRGGNDDGDQEQDEVKDKIDIANAKLKLKLKKKLELLSDDFKAREEKLSQAVEALKQELRVSNMQKKEKAGGGALELTDKLKRQITDMIQRELDKINP